MPGKPIPCMNCESEKKEIEKSGAFVVVSCTPLPNQDAVPANRRRCMISWIIRGSASLQSNSRKQDLQTEEKVILPLSSETLKKALPRCTTPDVWVAALNPALEQFDINSKARIASFLAQTGHESGQFNRLVENLNFSAARLVAVWPKRFTSLDFAAKYERNPEKLGNFVYANRIGNGDEASGDGFKYRGRGLIQLTGRSNYEAVSLALGRDFIKSPDDLQLPEFAALSAAWFWESRGLNSLADDETDDNDKEDFIAITKKINGGTAGLKERFDLFQEIERVL